MDSVVKENTTKKIPPKPFKVFSENIDFHSQDVLIGKMYRHKGFYYFSPNPEGDCIYDLRENIPTMDV